MTYLWEFTLHLAVTGWLIACAILDLRTRRVPNVLSIPPLVFAIVYTIFQGGVNLASLLIAAAIFTTLWLLGGIGGADIKVLVALAGLWPEGFLAALVVSALWGIFQYLSKGKRAWTAGLPPVAVAVMAGFGFECFLLFFKYFQGGIS